MTTLLTFLKKIPWWVYVAAVIGIVLLWQSMTGWAMAGKLYKQALDQLREDQTNVVETLQENQKMYEAEISRLQAEAERLKQQQVAARAETDRLRGLVRDKDIQILALKKERDAVVIPDDLNAIADEFRKRGYKPRVVIPPR